MILYKLEEHSSSVLRSAPPTLCLQPVDHPPLHVQALQSSGAEAISVFVTHPVFPKESWKQFTAAGEVKFANFWITDSIPHSLELAQHPPFKLLSLSDVIADSLLGYDLSLNS